MIVAADLAQVELLEEFHGVRFREAKLAYGYSLGELSAVACAGVFTMAEVLTCRWPWQKTRRAGRERRDGNLVFPRPGDRRNGREPVVSADHFGGHGTIAVSAILTPNTYLLLGQNDTIARFKSQMHEVLPDPAHIKINPERWPPLHTPIVRQKHIPDRAAVMMATTRWTSAALPSCAVARHRRAQLRRLSRTRHLRDWIDHPQRLGMQSTKHCRAASRLWFTSVRVLT
jgi:[acyl-carrier-protein] S-malonyltransferase